MSDVKELKEASIGALELGAFIIGKFKDGVQVADFSDIMAKFATDVEFKAVMEAAYKDAEKIPAEFKTMDIAGGLELVTGIIGVMPKVQELLSPKVA